MEWLIAYRIGRTLYHIKLDIPMSTSEIQVKRWWKLSKYKKFPFVNARRVYSHFVFAA